MTWGQRPAKAATLTKSQSPDGACGWEEVRFAAPARGNMEWDSQEGPETLTRRDGPLTATANPTGAAATGTAPSAETVGFL